MPFTVSGRHYTVMSAVAGDQHLASLIVAGHVSQDRLAVLERSALVLSAALLSERTFQDAQYRLQLELIDELLNPRSEDTEALKRRAGRFGLADNIPLVVRVVGVREDQRQTGSGSTEAACAGPSRESPPFTNPICASSNRPRAEAVLPVLTWARPTDSPR